MGRYFSGKALTAAITASAAAFSSEYAVSVSAMLSASSVLLRNHAERRRSLQQFSVTRISHDLKCSSSEKSPLKLYTALKRRPETRPRRPAGTDTGQKQCGTPCPYTAGRFPRNWASFFPLLIERSTGKIHQASKMFQNI